MGAYIIGLFISCGILCYIFYHLSGDSEGRKGIKLLLSLCVVYLLPFVIIGSSIAVMRVAETQTWGKGLMYINFIASLVGFFCFQMLLYKRKEK